MKCKLLIFFFDKIVNNLRKGILGMTIKNNQNSNMSNEKKKRIARISIFTLGTILVIGIAFKYDEEKAKSISYNQELEENLYESKQIRNYENQNFEGEYIAAELKDINFNTDSNLNSQEIFYTNIEEEIADDVIRGYYGNGENRKILLEEAGYDYERIQSLVNLKCLGQDYQIIHPNCIYPHYTGVWLSYEKTR